MKNYYLELEQVKNAIKILEPETLSGFNTIYYKVYIDGDLFYTGNDLLRPLTEFEIAVLLTEKEKRKLIKKYKKFNTGGLK
jgi:hypothetical protein